MSKKEKLLTIDTNNGYEIRDINNRYLGIPFSIEYDSRMKKYVIVPQLHIDGILDSVEFFDEFPKLEEFANDIYRKYLERKNGGGEN